MLLWYCTPTRYLPVLFQECKIHSYLLCVSCEGWGNFRQCNKTLFKYSSPQVTRKVRVWWNSRYFGSQFWLTWNRFMVKKSALYARRFLFNARKSQKFLVSYFLTREIKSQNSGLQVGSIMTVMSACVKYGSGLFVLEPQHCKLTGAFTNALY